MTKDKLVVAWIGAGVMGEPMAKHLVDAGYQVQALARNDAKKIKLESIGITAFDNLEQTIDGADVVFTILGDVESVRDVYFGNNGLISSAKTGQVFVDMTTTSPSLMEDIQKELASKECDFIDAPVTGGDIGAKNATLSIMVGGSVVVFQKILPMLEVMGNNVVHHGKIGNGQRAKLGNQIVIAGNMIGMCEGLKFAKNAGLDLEYFVKSIRTGSAYSWSVGNMAPRIINGDFETGFAIKHFAKDLKLVLDQCKLMNIHLSGLEVVEEIYNKINQNPEDSQKSIQFLFQKL